MKRRGTKEEIIKRIDYMLNNTDFNNVLYIYYFIGLKLKILTFESEV